MLSTETLAFIIFSVLAGLIGAVYKMFTARLDRLQNELFERLRTLGHEDRAIRSEISDLVKIIMQASEDDRRQVGQSMDLMASVFSRYGPIQRDKIKGE